VSRIGAKKSRQRPGVRWQNPERVPTPLSTAPTTNENQQTPKSGVTAARTPKRSAPSQDWRRRGSVLECGGKTLKGCRHRFRRHPRRTKPSRLPKAASQPHALQNAPRPPKAGELRASVLECGGKTLKGCRHRFRRLPRRTKTSRLPKAASLPHALQNALRPPKTGELRGSVLECGGKTLKGCRHRFRRHPRRTRTSRLRKRRHSHHSPCPPRDSGQRRNKPLNTKNPLATPSHRR
jgi:hypothetical protein